MSDSSNLKRSHSFLYALPAFVLAFPTIPVFVLLPSFYAESLGLGLATVGGVLFAVRVLDVISDPLLGWLSDRIPIAWGQRKLPMAIGGLIGAPALIFLFSPPQDVSALYLFSWAALLYLAWTAVQIPYLAWSAELATSYQARSRLNANREGAGLLGILAIGGIGVLLADQPESNRLATSAWLTAGAGVLTFILALKFVPQGRHLSRPESHKPATKPWRNTLFVRVLGAWFLNGLANGLPAVTLPLYITYILQGSDQDQSQFLMIYFLCAVLGIPLWITLAKRFSKHRLWSASMIFACAVFAIVPFLDSGNLIAFGIICALTGLALGSDLALPPAIQADCADWDRYRFKVNRLASLYAYWSMATKLALGLAVGLAFPILDWMGLEAGTAQGKTALIVIYALCPIVLKITAVALMWSFPLTARKHYALQRVLDRSSC